MNAGWSLNEKDPQFIRSLFPVWEWLYRYYFRVKTDGWQHIPNGKVLLVGSHSGGLSAPDLHMLMYDWYRRFGIERSVYGLMHAKMWEIYPLMAAITAKMGAVAAHPKVAMEAFKMNASVLVFPGGGQDVFRPFDQWDKINFAGRKAFIKLALKQKVPIVPIVSAGAHHTLFVIGDLYPIMKALHEAGLMPWPHGDPELCPVFIGSPWGIGIGSIPNIPFPMPIYIRICPCIKLYEGIEDESLFDNKNFINECYDKVFNSMQQSLDSLIQETPYRKNSFS